MPPVRDEESETQRKAHAKRVRETRRSTQGVTLDEIKSAEELVKKKNLNNNNNGVSIIFFHLFQIIMQRYCLYVCVCVCVLYNQLKFNLNFNLILYAVIGGEHLFFLIRSQDSCSILFDMHIGQ